MKRKIFTMLSATALLLFAITANARDYYLVASGGGTTSGSGMTWSAPMNFSAFVGFFSNVALPSGTNVYIQKGNYSATNGSLVIGLNNPNVLVQGGWPSLLTGTNLLGYDPVANPTIISIDGSNTQVFGTVATGASSGVSATLKGIQFTSTQSNASAFNAAASSAAGTYNFTDLYIYGMSGSSSGINLQSISGTTTANFTNCTFYNNAGAGQAGAIWYNTGANAVTMVINNCNFNGNNEGSIPSLGGGAISSGGNVTISNSTFCGNTSVGSTPQSGGAILVGGSSTPSTLTISGSTFSGNIGYDGGAIYIRNGKCAISSSNFYGNIATGYNGGAIAQQLGAIGNSTVQTTTFYSNQVTGTFNTYNPGATTVGGGAIGLVQGSGAPNWNITNCNFVKNSVPSNLYGGAISLPTGTGANIATMSGCVFYQNTKGGSSTTIGADIAAYGQISSPVFTSISSCVMQLASSSYQFGTLGSGSSPYNSLYSSFTNSNSGSNTTNDGGVGTPSYTCQTAPVSYTISGNVWDDANGDAINASEAFTNGGGLFANLLDATGTTVLQSIAVNASTGAYSFTSSISNAYKVVLTNSATAITSTLNTGWVNTGVNLGGTASTSNKTGIISIPASTTNITLQNFGIEQTPTANTPAQVITANTGGAAAVPTLTGTDPEDGTYNGTSGTNTIIITTLPSNGTLKYNGVAVTAGQTIANYNPTLLTVTPNTGIVSLSFTFQEVDAAGQPSAAATVTIPFYNTYGSCGTGLSENFESSTTTSHTFYTDATFSSACTVSGSPYNGVIGKDQTATPNGFSGLRVDHTTGTGYYLLNFTPSSCTGPGTAWGTGTSAGRQSIPVVAGQTYRFTAYVAGLNTQGPNASLQLRWSTNGSTWTVFSTLDVPYNSNWIPITGLVTATGSSIYLDIYDQTNSASGNDFGIDDITFAPSYTISGTVYDDANGLTDNTVFGTGTNAGGTLNAVLYDNTTGMVVNTTAVASNGTYTLADYTYYTLNLGDSYTVYLTTATATIGQTAVPATTLPSGWIRTGEYLGTGTGSDGTVNSILSIGVRGTNCANTTNANFGIEQPPTANTSYTKTGLAVSAFSYTDQPGYRGIPTNQPGLAMSLEGTDPEDGPATASSYTASTTFRILSIGSNTMLYYNGVKVVVGNSTADLDFDPSKLVIYGATTSAGPFSFTFSLLDAAKQVGTAATYSVSSSNILPITITNFSGVKTSAGNLLSWSASYAVNFSHFELQRSSNGGSFSTIANLGLNTSGIYSYTDASATGTNYYRLAMVDLDGSIIYSKTVAIVGDGSSFAVASVYPNPATSQLNIALYTPTSVNVTYTITDISGRVMSKEVHSANTATTQAINVSSLARGTYLITVDANGTKTTSKFTKL